MRFEKGDRFVADDRTAIVWRNGTPTIKRMFPSAAECSEFVAKRNAAAKKAK